MAEIHHINPPGRTPPVGYTHATAARGQRIIHISGQVAYDADGKIVGQGDLKRQTETACENLSSALAAAGAGLSDVEIGIPAEPLFRSRRGGPVGRGQDDHLRGRLQTVRSGDHPGDALPVFRAGEPAGQYPGGGPITGRRGVDDRDRGGGGGGLIANRYNPPINSSSRFGFFSSFHALLSLDFPRSKAPVWVNTNFFV